ITAMPPEHKQTSKHNQYYQPAGKVSTPAQNHSLSLQHKSVCRYTTPDRSIAQIEFSEEKTPAMQMPEARQQFAALLAVCVWAGSCVCVCVCVCVWVCVLGRALCVCVCV